MSARMETEPVSWDGTESLDCDVNQKALSEIQVESFVRNVETERLVASLRELRGEGAPDSNGGPRAEERRQTALALQEQWDKRFARREQMRMEIKRGHELLEQIQKELTVLRSRLDEWPGYETVCGKNPLSEYMQAIAAKERIEQYLPTWLKQREEQLHLLNREMEHDARQNGVEHLL